MGDFYRNHVLLFVSEEQQHLIPQILKNVASDEDPFDFNRLMPNGEGGGIVGLVVEAMESGKPLKADRDRMQKIAEHQELKWGCMSNAIFFSEEDKENCVRVSDPDQHYGYEDQEHCIKVHWVFETKNGSPDELARRFTQRAADLGMGAKWYIAGDTAWNPEDEQYDTVWELLSESTPNEISETQRIRIAAKVDQLFNLSEEF